MEEQTLAAYKWRVRDTAMWANDVYSPAGGIGEIRRVLDELDVLDMPIGPGVKVRNRYDLERMPDGTILSQGSPENVARYAVVTIRRGGMHHVLGRGTNTRMPYLVCEMPGFSRPEWLDVEPGADEVRLIREFMKQMWECGRKAQLRNAWCSTFNTVMTDLEVVR